MAMRSGTLSCISPFGDCVLSDFCLVHATRFLRSTCLIVLHARGRNSGRIVAGHGRKQNRNCEYGSYDQACADQ